MRTALLAFLIACSSSSPKAPPPQPTETGPASTGPLSEAEFKALHAPPTGQVPEPTGKQIDLADGTKAYLALPSGPGPHPGIVVIHEWWGLNIHIEHWA